ncbi:MAG TPA: caspase family protein [Longimicrobium sp.]|nr:caspase family protein [Longimicrobium sp.]
MGIGISLHIGLNEVDARHYGSPCPLKGCEGDAHAMRKLAVEAGFEPLAMMLGPAATSQAVLDAVRSAAPRIGGDGMLLLTYSGHGARVRDVCGNRGGPRYWDETWCTYDRQLLKDELSACWRDFAQGSRILVVSDSCFSGDIVRGYEAQQSRRSRKPETVEMQPVLWDAKPVDQRKGVLHLLDASVGNSELRAVPGGRDGGPAMRALPARNAARVYNLHQHMYDQIQLDVHAHPRRPIDAQVLLLAASQDNEPAQDGPANGAFTAALLQVWNGGDFEGSYCRLYEEIRNRLVPRQHPEILALKPPAFSGQRPFTI